MIVPQYIQNTVSPPIPLALFELLAFQDSLNQALPYSDGFEVIVDATVELSDWSTHQSFQKHLLPFAQADCWGAFYAIWTKHTDNIEEAPIVVFDHDGNYYVVAENFAALLKLISLDVEPMVDDDGIYFYKDEANYDPSPYNKNYKKWLKEYCHLSPIYNNFEAEQLIETAQERYQTLFDRWVESYL